LPKSEAFSNESAVPTSGHDLNFVTAVVERWRGSTVSHRAHMDDTRDAKPAPGPDLMPLQPTLPTEANRLGLLKKPLTSQPDPFAALRSAISGQVKR
jgi:hypothetical protein